MKPTEFSGQNVIFAKDQDEYLDLPAHVAKDGVVTSCWGLSWSERLQVLFTGKVYTQLLTFNKGLTPQALYVENPVGTVYE